MPTRHAPDRVLSGAGVRDAKITAQQNALKKSHQEAKALPSTFG
jgi:hypothetical protein